MTKRKNAIVFTIILLTGLLASCGLFQKDKTDRPNIIIITVDALRADHLSTYGYPYKTSPHIDDFADRSILFEYAYCPIPKTSASFASFMTGLHPFIHKTRPNRDSLKEKYITLAEALKLKGYYNAAVVDNANVSKHYKFHQGFDQYIEIWNEISKKQESTPSITQKVLEFLNNNERKPFFLWAHYIETHTPYLPPEQFVEERPQGRIIKKIERKIIAGERKYMTDDSDEGYFTSLYDGAVKYIDSEFEKITSLIFEKKYHKNSIIIFSSDHGEDLGEYNFFYNHGPLTFNASARVPLILSVPGERSRRIKYPVSLMDVYPTLLSKVGLSLPYNIQGRDLFTAPAQRYLFIKGHAGTDAVVINNYHLVRVSSTLSKKLDLKRIHFFDIYEDPYEKNNISHKKQRLQDAMANEYDQFFKKHGYLNKMSPEEKEPPLTKEELESLKALGYIE
jgi:arylsulfatase A-like enzyme